MEKKMEGTAPVHKRIEWTTFLVSFLIVMFFFCWAQMGEDMGELMKKILNVLTHQFGAFYLIFGFSCVIFAVWLALGPYSHIKLGSDTDAPKFSNFSWFSMLFACGYGVGLVYWGAAEPLSFLAAPPLGIEANSSRAAEIALSYSYFHWGWTPWAIYLTITIPVGYFVYRKKMPPRFSSALSPLIGNHHKTFWGKIIDSALIIGLIGGLCTSIGLGIMQLVSGIENVFNIPSTGKSLYIIIGILWCGIFTVSAVSGVEKGIKLLSNINIPLAIFLMVFVFFVSEPQFCMNLGISAFGDYLSNFFRMSFWTDPIDQGGFPQGWTIFYWAWWFACAPILGIFTSYISQGRTIRQIVIGHMVFAPVATWLWFMTFGGSALFYEIKAKAGLVDLMGSKGSTAVIYAIIDKLPLSGIISFLFMVLIVVFLSTSADSASFICAQLCTKDDHKPNDPPKSLRAIWAITLGVLAMTLVLVGKGISALQLSSIVASIFVIFVMIGMVWSFIIEVKKEIPHKQSIEIVQQGISCK